MDPNNPNTFNTYAPNNPDTTNTYDHYDVYFQGDRDRYMRDYAAYEQFVALCEQEAGGSGSASKKTRTYIPCEREDVKQWLIDDNFSDDETLPKYPEEYFRRIQCYDAVGRKSIGPILKCTYAIRQLAYDTEPDAFDEYLQIVERFSRQCLENFTKCIHVLYIEKFLRKPISSDIQNSYELHEEKHGLPGMLRSIDCMHWEWRNCPKFLHGVPRANNDLNVLYGFPLFDDELVDKAPECPFVVNGHTYKKALCEQEAGCSRSAPKRTRTYIPREREDSKQRLIDDYFGDDETLPKYPEEYFRRRQRYDAVGRKSIDPILKCTSVICQLAYVTAPDAFAEYLHIVERCSRQCLENFTKCIHVLYVEKFLRKPTSADIQKTYELHEEKHGLPGMLRSIDSGSENRPPMLNKDNYVPWTYRLLRYEKSRPNEKLIYNSIMNVPYVRRMIPEPGDPNREVPVLETFHEQTDDELTEAKIKQMEADDQAIQTILLGLPEDIYAAADSCETAQEI
nr:hypothetical protein [Tanacetum cinerariifolium]